VALFSYSLIHRFQKVLSLASIVVFGGAFMSTVTVIEPYAALKVTPRVRAGFMLVICAAATDLCTLAQDA